MGSKCIRTALLGAIVGLSLTAAPAFGQSNNDIVGLWSFNGGLVGVTKNADKSFTGTVVKPTTSGACSHPVGEQMWTGVRLAGNLNFFGKHVWFLTGPCRLAPATGNTAWKIFSDVNGRRFLRGCYANWANPSLQPQIDIAGNSDPGAGGACIDSYAVRGKKTTFGTIATFPKKKCVASSLKLTFKDPPSDALAGVDVYAGKVHKEVVRSKLSVTVKAGSGSGKLKVKVVARTLLGVKVTGSKVYKTC